MGQYIRVGGTIGPRTGRPVRLCPRAYLELMLSCGGRGDGVGGVAVGVFAYTVRSDAAALLLLFVCQPVSCLYGLAFLHWEFSLIRRVVVVPFSGRNNTPRELCVWSEARTRNS